MKRHGNYELLTDAELLTNAEIDILFIERYIIRYRQKARNTKRHLEKQKKRLVSQYRKEKEITH